MRRHWCGIIQCLLLAGILLALIAEPMVHAVSTLLQPFVAAAHTTTAREACENAKRMLARYRQHTSADSRRRLEPDPLDEGFRERANTACSKVPGEPQAIILGLR